MKTDLGLLSRKGEPKRMGRYRGFDGRSGQRSKWNQEHGSRLNFSCRETNTFSLWERRRVKMESVQFRSVAQSCPTLCEPMSHSMPGLAVHHQLPEFTQTHVHWVGDAIQPSHSLSFPSPPASHPSQHQSLFQWVNSLHEMAKVLEFQLQHQSFQWTPRTQDQSPLGWTGWISLQSKGLSGVLSNTTVQKHPFFNTQLSSQSNSHIHTWPLEKP